MDKRQFVIRQELLESAPTKVMTPEDFKAERERLTLIQSQKEHRPLID